MQFGTKMASGKTEYQEEYCGMHGSKSGRGKSATGTSDVIGCTKSYEVQPVGGRMAAKKQAEEAQRLATMDQEFVCQSYSSSEHGTHRILPKWQDPRWSDPVRTSDATLYDSSRRDPPNRETSFLYRSTFTDALMTPCQPLAVPDVHKLRYMNNNYMTADDWY